MKRLVVGGSDTLTATAGTNLVGMGEEGAWIKYDCQKDFGEELRDGGVGGLNRRSGDVGKYAPVRLDDQSQRNTDEEEEILE